MSNHRLAPLNSTPIIGTSARRIKEKINNGIISFLKNEVLIAEIKNIIVNAINVKLKCLKKKNNNLYLISPQLIVKLMKMKKITQEKKVIKSLKVFFYQYFSNSLVIES